MKQYTDEALKTIQEEAGRIYAKLASLKPNDNFTRDDIRSTMYYVRAFQNMARAEETRRKIESRKK